MHSLSVRPMKSTSPVGRFTGEPPAGSSVSSNNRISPTAGSSTAASSVIRPAASRPNQVARNINFVSNLSGGDTLLIGIDFRLQNRLLYGVGNAGGV